MANVPVANDALGPWLEITVVGFEQTRSSGEGTGSWTYAIMIQLWEIVTVRRDGHWNLLISMTWSFPLVAGSGPKEECRDSLLKHVAEAAEEISNLYLATR